MVKPTADNFPLSRFTLHHIQNLENKDFPDKGSGHQRPTVPSTKFGENNIFHINKMNISLTQLIKRYSIGQRVSKTCCIVRKKEEFQNDKRKNHPSVLLGLASSTRRRQKDPENYFYAYPNFNEES